jgi:uncharacterized protein
MSMRPSRREFLKSTTAAVMLGTAEKALNAAATSLPKRRLGKTGEMVSCLGFGAGNRFCSIEDEAAAQALLERALNLGISYFDTATTYTRKGIERLSEKRLGEFIKPRRRQIFLAIKVEPRERDEALRSIELSLKNLQTDYVDLLQIHSLNSPEEIERIGAPDGVLAAIQKIKEQKAARFIGITGHNDGAAMTEALRRFDLDTVLMALNAAQSASPIAVRKMEPIPAFEQSALPLALKKNMGILAMKSMGQGMLIGTGAGRAAPVELLQFNLGLPVASVIVGCERISDLEQNIQTALNFTPLSDTDKKKLQEKVTPSRLSWQNFLRSHDDGIAV